MSELAEGQYSLETLDGKHTLLFGEHTDVRVSVCEHGAPEWRVNDAEIAEADGVRFGRDFLGARMLTFDMHVLTPPRQGPLAARRAYDEFAAQWRGDYVRNTAGEVAVLRYKLGGTTRRVYGRSRKIAAVSGATKRGWIPVTAEFKTADDRYYADEAVTHSVVLRPPSQAGFTMPVIAPITMSGTGRSNPGAITVRGKLAAFPVLTIHGPIYYPVIDVAGRWRFELRTELAFDQSVTIDPRSFNRGVIRNDGASLAGRATSTSPRLDQLWLEPGEYDVVLRGIDPTGTASLFIDVHEAYASL